MLKLGIDVNKNIIGKLQLSCALLALVYAAMITATILVLPDIINAEFQFPVLISYINSNAFATLFMVAFCLVLHSIYRRFDIINKCLR